MYKIKINKNVVIVLQKCGFKLRQWVMGKNSNVVHVSRQSY